MFHFTIRELALVIVIVAIGIAWWCDRWLAESTLRGFHEKGHQQLLEQVQSEVQRAADESGVRLQVEAAARQIIGQPKSTASR